MKFDLISDIHFSSYKLDDLRGINPSSPILMLLGDVCEVYNFNHVKKFFEYISKNWNTVLYVPGNHEFYGGDLRNTVNEIRRNLSVFKNIILIDNEVISIDNVRFIGSTLWSDMEKENPLSMMTCKDYINDYHHIWKRDKGKITRITPQDTIRLFKRNINFIKTVLDPLCDNVVLTHHAPSFKSISPQYVGNACNGAFVSDLDEFILNHPEIKIWAHGHTHSKVDYEIGSCRVIGNPLGYRGELFKNENAYKPMTIEVIK